MCRYLTHFDKEAWPLGGSSLSLHLTYLAMRKKATTISNQMQISCILWVIALKALVGLNCCNASWAHISTYTHVCTTTLPYMYNLHARTKGFVDIRQWTSSTSISSCLQWNSNCFSLSSALSFFSRFHQFKSIFQSRIDGFNAFWSNSVCFCLD